MSDDDSEKFPKSENEEDEEGGALEVVKEFTLDFEKKLAKYIPPKIEFKSDLNKLTVVTTIDFNDEFISRPKLFFGYLILNVKKGINFYDKTYNLIYNKNFVGNNEEDEILGIKILDEETLIISATDKVSITRFYEKEPKKITCEIIQEISDTQFYFLNEILSNNLLLLSGLHKKYVFYQLEYYAQDQKFGPNNKFKKIGEIDKVHNVYDDDCPGIIDLNNGRLFSWMNDDSNIKIIEYSPDFKIIKSKNGYQLHNAGLINDKYICLMGLKYPKFYTWLMDTESLEIVKTIETPENDSFIGSICENKFFCGSDISFKIDTINFENGEFVRKTISKRNFSKNGEENWKESFMGALVIDEKTFVTTNLSGRLLVFQGQ